MEHPRLSSPMSSSSRTRASPPLVAPEERVEAGYLILTIHPRSKGWILTNPRLNLTIRSRPNGPRPHPSQPRTRASPTPDPVCVAPSGEEESPPAIRASICRALGRGGESLSHPSQPMSRPRAKRRVCQSSDPAPRPRTRREFVSPLSSRRALGEMGILII